MIDESALRALTAAVGDPVVITDLSGHVVAWNPGACELWGREPGEVLGRVLPHLPKERRTGAVADIRRAAAGPVTVDETTERGDGTPVRVTLTLLPVADEEGAVFEVVAVASGPCVGALADRLLADDAGPVSTEVRRHVTAIVGYGQLLSRDEVQRDPSKRHRVRAALESRSAQLADLAEDVDVLERLASGVLVPKLVPTELPGVLADAIGAAERLVPGSAFSVEYDPSLPAVEADPRMLGRALARLLTESAEAGEAGARVEVSLTREGGEIVVRIRGAAGGHEPRGARSGSTGLGSVILSRVAEAHRGEVTVGAHAGGATETSLRLPVGRKGVSA